MSCIWPQLNILSTSLVKPHYTLKMTIHLLFTVHTLRLLYVFRNVLDFV